MTASRPNTHEASVEAFGEEWSEYDQTGTSGGELEAAFEKYFSIFPWDQLRADAAGFDAGCGSGRWARFVAPRVGTLHCVDASAKALAVARRNLSGLQNCVFHLASVAELPFGDASMDFAYSLGVLHHIPDTEAGIAAVGRKLKPGAPLLLYLYYAFDNRPFWYRTLWRVSDGVRRVISRLPRVARLAVTKLIAAAVYWPLARLSRSIERLGLDARAMPLHWYRNHSLYTMMTDALDRFGTPLEHRFTAREIEQMLLRTGFRDLRFSPSEPYWCVVARKAT